MTNDVQSPTESSVRPARSGDVLAIAVAILGLCALIVLATRPAVPGAVSSAALPSPAAERGQVSRVAFVPAEALRGAVTPTERGRSFTPALALRSLAQAYEAELTCLTEAIYYEARGESYSGRLAVADVVLNRVYDSRYPDTVCKVVYQGPLNGSKGATKGCQFSFTCDGSLRVAPRGKAWEEARRLAELALLGFQRDLTNDATHYHADYVDPDWAGQLKRTVRIGRHIFYRTAG